MKNGIREYIVECIGTFFLVFCGCGAIVVDQVSGGQLGNVGIGICFGLVVTAVIYAFGWISGAHINPAVTVAFHLAKILPSAKVIGYILAQCVGALLACLVLKLLFPGLDNYGVTLPKDSVVQTFILELILTYILMMVILFNSQNPALATFTGLSVGMTVMLEAIFAGPITGASMNPARSLGPAIVSGIHEHLWIYLIATTLGAIGASFTWNYLKPTS